MPSKKPVSAKESSYSRIFHPRDLVTKMEQGKFRVQIIADWNISSKTFAKWRNEYEDFEEAYQVALPKLEAYWIENGMLPMITGKNQNKHSFKTIETMFNHEFEYNKEASRFQNGTTININNINLQEKSIAQLQEQITNNMEFLTDRNVINAEYKLLTNDSQSNQQDS